MKKIVFFIISILFFLTNAEAQEKLKPIERNSFSCATSSVTANLVKKGLNTDFLHVRTDNIFNNNNYCIKVYIHKVTKTHDLTTGISDAILNQQVNLLQEFFDNGGDSGIDFVWDGNILEVNDDVIYGGTTILPAPNSHNFTPLDSFSHDDGIDIFFMDVNLGKSFSDGIANGSRVVINNFHVNTGGVAHEVGHVLGLFHTYHSRDGGQLGENNDGYGNHTPIIECPSQSDSERAGKGDFVRDTPADAGHYTSFDNINCTVGFPNDSPVCNGEDFPRISTENLMTSGVIDCFNHFSFYQKRRMKHFINTRPFLQNALAPSCTLTDCSKLCNTTQRTSNDDIIPEFTYAIDECLVTFNGRNDGRYCENDTYEWTINGEVVSTSENFNYTFTQNGNYNVIFKIKRGQGNCEEMISKTIFINNCSTTPDPDPICPPASCLSIVEVDNCEDYQVWMNCNDPDIHHIDWYYTIGTHNHVFAGTSTGNEGQHAYPIYLPDPPSLGSWNNYILTVYGKVYFKNGTVCEEILTRRRLSCSGNVGDPFLKAYPNPIKNTGALNFEGISLEDIKEIEIFNLKGKLLKAYKSARVRNLNIKDLKPGIYIAHIKTVKMGLKKVKFLVEE